jgi:hypothetical protein
MKHPRPKVLHQELLERLAALPFSRTVLTLLYCTTTTVQYTTHYRDGQDGIKGIYIWVPALLLI